MSDGTGTFTTGEVAMSFFTAFILGAGASFTVGMLFSGGKVNWQGIAGVVAAGLVTAAKDYRALKRLPAVSNGNTETITKV